MMKDKILIWALATAGSVLSVSCVKEAAMDEKYRPEGTEIIFGAQGEYENAAEETRTEFTGTEYTYSSKKYERINWVSGDKMAINYQRSSMSTQQGVYTVTSFVGSSNEVHEANVERTSGTKLTWNGGSGNHKFFAMYPESSMSTRNGGGVTITGSIPGSQPVVSKNGKYLPADMTKAYMAGYKIVSSTGTTSRVTIPFAPAVTIFEFVLKRAASGTTWVKKAELEGTKLTGTFHITMTGPSSPDEKGDNWWNHAESGTNPTSIDSGYGNKITVNLSGFNSGKGLSMTNSTALDFTVLANPIAYSSLTLTLTMSTDNGSHWFTKKVNLAKSGGFAACKKHIVSNSNVPDGTWEYTFEHAGTTITAGGNTYQEIVGDTGSATFNSYYKEAGTGETAYPVTGFTVEYAPDNNGAPGTTWSTTTRPTGVSTITVTDNASSSSQTISDTWNTNTGTLISTLNQWRGLNMQSKGSYGTDSAPQDLSLCTVASSGITTRSSGATTANCYIVDRPGWYMFPLVYGNAITGGAVNTSSYTTSATVSNGWSTLHNYNGSNISSAYILTDINSGATNVTNMDAICLWQDASGSTATATWDPTFISDVSVFTPSDAAVASSYIKFYVNPATVHPGNAVIALRKSDTIVWSWHIWLTDGVTDGDGKGDGFPTFTLENSSGNPSGPEFLKMPLGECPSGTVSGVTASSERVGWVRVTQTASDKKLLFRIVQPGVASGTPTVNVTDRAPTYYQWGRKDPFLPRKGGSTTNNKDCTSYSSSYVILQESSSVDATAAKSIKNPHIFYHIFYSGAIYNWISDSPVNLWNMNQTSDETDNGTVTKTVYDPCPPGFRLPDKNAFTGATSTGSWSSGWTFKITGGTYYAYAHGWRLRTNGVLNSVKSLQGFLTSCGTSDNRDLALTSASNRITPTGSESRASGFPVLPARDL